MVGLVRKTNIPHKRWEVYISRLLYFYKTKEYFMKISRTLVIKIYKQNKKIEIEPLGFMNSRL